MVSRQNVWSMNRRLRMRIRTLQRSCPSRSPRSLQCVAAVAAAPPRTAARSARAGWRGRWRRPSGAPLCQSRLHQELREDRYEEKSIASSKLDSNNFKLDLLEF